MSKLAYPKGRLLLVRDCTVDICLKNNPGAVLLSVLLFWYDNPHKGDWYNEGLHEFCMCRTQAEIEEASCHQIDVKTIHDTAIPLLYLLGYLHVGKKMHGDLYILHMDRILAAFAAYEQSEKAKDPTILKSFLRSQLESAPIEIPEDELEPALINKSRLYFEIERALIRIREGSNCKRGPKPRPQRAAEAISENIEIIRDSIEIDTKRDSGAFAPSDFLPLEEDFSEEDEAPTVRMPAIKIGASNGSTHTELSNGRDRGNTGDGGILRTAGRSVGQAERTALDAATGSQALQVQPKAQEITSQQTPGVSLQDDQAISAPFVSPEPAQIALPPEPAQATGARGKPEKPVQQALSTTTEASGDHVTGASNPTVHKTSTVVAQERTQEKPKRGRKEAAPELPAEVLQFLDDWDSLHRAPLPRTDRLIALAKAGVQAKITREELKGCRNWLPTTDRPGKPYYRHKGVGLWDVIDKIGEYRSLQNMPIPGVPLADMKPARAPGTTGFDIYKGNGLEEREAQYQEALARLANGTLIE